MSDLYAIGVHQDKIVTALPRVGCLRGVVRLAPSLRCIDLAEEVSIGTSRPVQGPYLSMRSTRVSPGRPHLVRRSGCPGVES